MNRNLAPEWEDVNGYASALEGRDYDLDTRLRLLLLTATGGQSNWKAMELETGVKAEKWRQFAKGATKASVELAEATAHRWPQYAFWLLTGVSDEKHGHHAPHLFWRYPNYDDEDEFQDEQKRQASNYEKTIEYFRLAAKLARRVWAAGHPRTQMSSSILGKDKTSMLRKTDKHFDRESTLLHTLAKLKDDEFLQNNSHLQINEEVAEDRERNPEDALNEKAATSPKKQSSSTQQPHSDPNRSGKGSQRE